MITIESQSGDTIFEAFFQAMAFLSWGLGAYAFGRLVLKPEARQKGRVDLSEQSADTTPPPDRR
jgi:hypothetical protein